MLAVRILAFVAAHVQKVHFHLQRRVSEQAQKLGLGSFLGGHKIDDRHAQGPYILARRAFVGHHEYVFQPQRRHGGQFVWNFYRHIFYGSTRQAQMKLR